MSTMKDIARMLSQSQDVPAADAEQFVASMFDVLRMALTTDSSVKIKGLGTFKVQTMKQRSSVNVNSGERFVIDSHDRVTFTPDKTLAESVNKPFSHFETVMLNDGVEFEDLPDSQETSDNMPMAEESSSLVQNAVAEAASALQQMAMPEPVVPQPTAEPEPIVPQPTVIPEPVIPQPSIVETAPVIPQPTVAPEPFIVEPNVVPEPIAVPEPVAVPEPIAEPEQERQSDETAVAPDEIIENGQIVKKKRRRRFFSNSRSSSGVSQSQLESRRSRAADLRAQDSTFNGRVVMSLLGLVLLVFVVGVIVGRATYDIPLLGGYDEKILADAKQQVDADDHTIVNIDVMNETKRVRDSINGKQTMSPEEKAKLEAERIAAEKALNLISDDAPAPDVAEKPKEEPKADAKPKVEEKPKVEAKPKVEEKPKADAKPKVEAKPKAEPKIAAPKPKADPKPEKKPAAKPEPAKVEKKAEKKPEAPAKKDYNSDPRVRTGGYTIIGTSTTVTVQKGQTLSSISAFHLGPGMECYVEALNGVKTVKPGQKLKIPKLQLKRKL